MISIGSTPFAINVVSCLPCVHKADKHKRQCAAKCKIKNSCAKTQFPVSFQSSSELCWIRYLLTHKVN